MPEPILRYAVAAKEMSRDEFLEAFPHPVFVIEPFVALMDTGFQTRVSSEGALEGITVATVSKRPGANAFSSMITVGRAGNNDIELKHTSISKFHAYLTPAEDGEMLLVDAGSSYGTFVGEKQLKPKIKRVLASKSGTRFASLNTTFYSAADFYQVLVEANRYGQGS